MFFLAVQYHIYILIKNQIENILILILVEEEYVDIIRQLVQQSNLYKPELDSINLNLDGDYGLKVFVDEYMLNSSQ